VTAGGATHDPARDRQHFDWERLEREVVERLHLLRLGMQGEFLGPDDVRERIWSSLVLPTLARLMEFVLAVDLSGNELTLRKIPPREPLAESVLSLALLVGRHWQDQDGVNVLYLDQLADAVKAYDAGEPGQGEAEPPGSEGAHP